MNLDDYARAYLRQLHGGVPVDVQIYHLNFPDQRAIVAFRPGRPWVEVISLAKNARLRDPQRFSFNLYEGRWAYDVGPKNASKIRKAIERIVPTNRT